MILAEPRGRTGTLGRLGEQAAEAALERAGLTVLERRFRIRAGEIDLIALDGDAIVFVEVKTRTGSGYGSPAESVTALKQRRLARVALAYLRHRGWLDRPCRFDVIEVYASGSSVRRLCHIEDAFRP